MQTINQTSYILRVLKTPAIAKGKAERAVKIIKIGWRAFNW